MQSAIVASQGLLTASGSGDEGTIPVMTECVRTTRHVNVPSHANAFITDRGIGCLFMNGALFEILPLLARVYKQ